MACCGACCQLGPPVRILGDSELADVGLQSPVVIPDRGSAALELC